MNLLSKQKVVFFANSWPFHTEMEYDLRPIVINGHCSYNSQQIFKQAIT